VVDARTTAQQVANAIRSLPGTHRPPAVTLRGDPGQLEAIVEALCACGTGPIHVRTSLPGTLDQARRLLDARIDVVSVDLAADSPTTYAAITGRDDHDAVRSAMELLAAQSRIDEAEGGGLPSRWIVLASPVARPASTNSRPSTIAGCCSPRVGHRPAVARRRHAPHRTAADAPPCAAPPRPDPRPH
jgi:hypothetical protein